MWKLLAIGEEGNWRVEALLLIARIESSELHYVCSSEDTGGS
jgi:hypothetical protein